MRVKLISIKQDNLIIEPIKNTSSPFSYSKDLSIELRDLKIELKSKHFDLIEGRDYTVNEGPYPKTDPYYQIQFSGKSAVLRALFTIPAENFDLSQTYPTISKEGFALRRSEYAMAISDRECAAYEIPFVIKTQNELLELLILEITKAHRGKASPVITQLTNDLQLIKNKQPSLWSHTNFQLSCAALYHAYMLEKKKPTVLEGSFSFIGSGTPVLLNDYSRIFSNFSAYLGNCEGYNPNYDRELRFNFLETNYYSKVEQLAVNSLPSLTIS